MITKTLNLDSAYQELFDEVREKSNGAINVNNLEAFFGSITEIAALDSKFLRLPLDEPLFEIDANTRKITIPAEFRSNGVSVQKDHLAEIIFFRIARFFDYTDLSTCDIVINWKMGSNEGKTTRFIKFNEPYKVVEMGEETALNGIVFGWPINNIVTEKSGQLTFAIEFFKKAINPDTNEEEIIYSFNTLPATVNIKDGLVISEEVEAVTLDTDILRTLVNSSFGEGTAAVGDLVWITGDGNGLVVGEANDNGVVLKDFVATLNLPTSIVSGVPQSAPVSLYAYGYVDEFTDIQYSDMNNIPVGSQEPVSQVTFDTILVDRPLVLVESTQELDTAHVAYFDAEGNRIENFDNLDSDVFTKAPLIEGLKYYVHEDSEDPDAYELASSDDVAAWGTVDMVDLYVKVAKTVAAAAGTYFIYGQGYKMGTDEDNPRLHKIGSGELKSTSSVIIPNVEAPSAIELTLPQSVLPEPDYKTPEDPENPDAEREIQGYYSLADNIENVIFLNGSQAVSITATAAVDNFGALQFVWQKKIGDATEFTNVYEGEGEVPFQDANGSELSISAAGQYQVKATNFLNGASATLNEPAVVTASILAGKITNDCVSLTYQRGNTSGSIISDVSYRSQGNQSQRSITLTATVNEAGILANGPVGTIEYQWYKSIPGIDENEQEIFTLEPIAERANSASYIVSGGDSGYFVPVIRNNYNGSVYNYQANTIQVIDWVN